MATENGKTAGGSESEVIVGTLEAPAESKVCIGCAGSGREMRPSGELECKFCEGRGWVLPVECCSCGRPSGQVVEREVWGRMRKFALCMREECVKKFVDEPGTEFEDVELEVVGEEDWGGWGV